MVPSHKPNQISRPDDLRLRLDECVRAVLQRSEKADNFTDISGAVAVAAETAQTGFDTRVLIIMSDFREDRPHGEPSIQYKLHGERVAMIHRPEERDRPDMRGYQKRVDEWNKRFMTAGATTVCTHPMLTVTANLLVKCLKTAQQSK